MVSYIKMMLNRFIVLKNVFKDVRNVLQIIRNLKRLSDRQDAEEVRALYGAGSYVMSRQYIKFKVESSRWHSWSEGR